METKKTKKLIACFDILVEKYKIDIQEVTDFKDLIYDLERD